MHSCGPWTDQGINCPGSLFARGEEFSPDSSDDELIRPVEVGDRFEIIPVFHRKAKALAATQVSNFQLAALLELGRMAAVRGLEEALPPQVRVPAEMVKEAFRQGARGKTLALWVAAASATLAIGVRFGPGAAAVIPRLIRPTGGGGIGFRFQAPTFRELVKKRLGAPSASGGGDFFAGILG